MKTHGIVAVIASLLLSACATTRFPEAEFPKNDTDLDILATQQEIEAETKLPNPLVVGGLAGAGGIVGGVVVGAMAGNMYRTNKERAAEAIVPLRDHMGEYDLSGEFVERIQAAAITEQLVSGAEPVVWRSPGPPEEREIERRLITLEPRVRLSNDMRTLLVDLKVWEFFPRDGYTPPRDGFSQKYRFLWPLTEDDELDRDEALAAWLDRPRNDLIALIEMGMEQTTKMLETHLKQKAPVFEDRDEIVRIPPSGNFYLWQEHEETSWLARKSSRGVFYAVPDHAIETAPERHQITR